MKKNVDYLPEIIANPYNNIYSSMQWFKDERLWYISPHKL